MNNKTEERPIRRQVFQRAEYMPPKIPPLASRDRRSKDIRVQVVSHASNTRTISDISQSLEVTPAAIAGVIFKV
jgi:hypothetical protein